MERATASKLLEHLEAVRTGAYWHDASVGEWLPKQRLIRHKRTTGWFDLTPLGRPRREALRREGP